MLVSVLNVVRTCALAAQTPLHRGDMHVQPEFLNVSELAALKQALAAQSVLDLRETRTSYARQKQLLDVKALRHLSRHASLLQLLDPIFKRANGIAASLSFHSTHFDMRSRRPGLAKHISWHSAGSDFPPHVDFAPNCVAVLIYLGSAGEEFDGGELQTRGCPGLMQCPLYREEYNLSISERVACKPLRTHTPRAGELVAFLAETAHAVRLVTRGTRIAINSWLNCKLQKRAERKQVLLPRHTSRNTQAAMGRCAEETKARGNNLSTSAADGEVTFPVTAAGCSTRLVFYVGLQKSGTTSFHDYAAALGYEAVKLPTRGFMFDKRHLYTAVKWLSSKRLQPGAATKELQLPQSGLLTMFNVSRSRFIAASDLPIFGLACELAAAYPDAAFVQFTRSFASWWKSERTDVLCNWMRYPRAFRNRRRSWQRGFEFMQFMWGDGFAAFRKALLAAPERLCSSNSTAAEWTVIRGHFQRAFIAHQQALRKCLGPERIFTRPLAEANAEAPALARFLGCSNISVPYPHTSGAAPVDLGGSSIAPLSRTATENRTRRTLLLTFSNRADGNNGFNVAWRINYAYAAQWGYATRMVTKRQLPQGPEWQRTRHVGYEKWHAIGQALKQGYESVVWLDDDAFINDDNTPVTRWTDAMAAAGVDVLVPVQARYRKQAEQPNAGLMVVRASPRTLWFFTAFRAQCELVVQKPPHPWRVPRSLTWMTCGNGCPDQECFHQQLLSNKSISAAVAILDASVLSCHPAHFSYGGTCDPWAVHTLGWTKGFFLDPTASARLRLGRKLSAQDMWNIALQHNPSYSKALGNPPPRTVPSRTQLGNCSVLSYTRVASCLII